MTELLEACTAFPLKRDALMDERFQWVHVLPAGRFTGIDGRGPWLLDDAQAVANTTRSYHGKRKIVVDYEHQTDNAPKNGKANPAAGWIDALEARKDGLWARVEWTETASAHIEAREYRYVSPVFRFNGKSGEVSALLRVALTNNPALDQLTALAREEAKMSDVLSRIRSALGIDVDENDDAVLSRIEELLSKTESASSASAPDLSKFVPIGDFERVVAEANKLRQGISQNAAEDHVSRCIENGKLAPFLKDWAVALCTHNKPDFEAFLERTGPAFNAIITPQLGNKALRIGRKTSGLSASETAVCQRMGIDPEKFETTRLRAEAETE